MDTDTSKVCIVYCRVSSEKQAKEDKGSLDDQAANGLRKASELKLQVLRVQKDDARAGKFGVLIVDRMNRFSRTEDMGEYMQVMTALRDAGIKLVFAQKDYGEGPTGQLMQFLDAWQSAGEQANRRKQAQVGKRTSVLKHHHTLPGSWPLYGYRWLDDKKTQADFDVDAEGNPTESQRTVRRIWHHFLYAEHPTLSGTAKMLNREGVRTPREYAGVKAPSNSVQGSPRWTADSIRYMLHNPVYWGGKDGKVPAYRYSKFEDETEVPAFAPAYVTPEQAARVHARLKTNQQYAARNRKREWGTLLHGGLVRCAECDWALTPHEYKKPRADGSLLTLYRCQQGSQFGKGACKGVAISAEVLDFAVEATLDQELNKGDFLTRFFAAWEADAEVAMGTVREIEATIKDTSQQIENQVKRLATLAPGDVLAAPVEANVRMLQETLPGLDQRRDNALAAITKARGNDTLRQELSEWFWAWLEGFHMLPRGRQREFLFAIGAKVTLYREGERTPRAKLTIALPTAPLSLPVAPESTLRRDEGTGGWALDVDMEEGEARVALAREYRDLIVDGGAPPAYTSLEDDIAEYEELLLQRGQSKAAARLRATQIARSRPRHPRTAKAAVR